MLVTNAYETSLLDYIKCGSPDAASGHYDNGGIQHIREPVTQLALLAMAQYVQNETIVSALVRKIAPALSLGLLESVATKALQAGYPLASLLATVHFEELTRREALSKEEAIALERYGMDEKQAIEPHRKLSLDWVPPNMFAFLDHD